MVMHSTNYLALDAESERRIALPRLILAATLSA